MSTATQTRSPATSTVPLGRKTRWAVALLMPVGPAAVGVLRYVLPYYTESTSPGIAAAVAEHPGAQSLVLWLGYLAMLTLVPGVLAAAQLTRAQAPRLTGWTIALLVPAYLSLSGLLVSDNLLWSGHEAAVGSPVVVAMLDALHPTVLISLGVFVVGHVVGTVLLGIAFLRTHRIPIWAAVVLAVSQPVHFVAAVVLGSPTVDLIGWAGTAVGMGMAGRALLRQGEA